MKLKELRRARAAGLLDERLLTVRHRPQLQAVVQPMQNSSLYDGPPPPGLTLRQLREYRADRAGFTRDHPHFFPKPKQSVTTVTPRSPMSTQRVVTSEPVRRTERALPRSPAAELRAAAQQSLREAGKKLQEASRLASEGQAVPALAITEPASSSVLLEASTPCTAARDPVSHDVSDAGESQSLSTARNSLQDARQWSPAMAMRRDELKATADELNSTFRAQSAGSGDTNCDANQRSPCCCGSGRHFASSAPPGMTLLRDMEAPPSPPRKIVPSPLKAPFGLTLEQLKDFRENHRAAPSQNDEPIAQSTFPQTTLIASGSPWESADLRLEANSQGSSAHASGLTKSARSIPGKGVRWRPGGEEVHRLVAQFEDNLTK